MSSNPVCRKCGATPYIVLDKVHVECKDCFVSSCGRKFRQALGRSKLVNINDSLLVAFSGGQSSHVLLDLMKSRQQSSTSLEPKFKASILHVDMQSLFCDTNVSSTLENRRDKLLVILRELRQSCPNWPVYWTPIEAFMFEQGEIFAKYEQAQFGGTALKLLTNDVAHSRLKEAIKQADNLTDKQTLVTDVSFNLINRVADHINANNATDQDKFKCVLVGSNATQLANKLLVDVILGRGSTLRPNVSLLDDSLPVPVLRPLKEFSKKEVAFYVQAKNLPVSTQPNLLTKVDRKACIQTLTESFLSKLDRDYPATYSTLLKTGDKLA